MNSQRQKMSALVNFVLANANGDLQNMFLGPDESIDVTIFDGNATFIGAWGDIVALASKESDDNGPENPFFVNKLLPLGQCTTDLVHGPIAIFLTNDNGDLVDMTIEDMLQLLGEFHSQLS